MKFMLMILDNEEMERSLAPGELDRLVEGHVALSKELRRVGKWVAGERLRDSSEAVKVRKTRGALAMTDGPFAETKEVLGGFYIIECASKDEAIAWARRVPMLEGEAVEVRPVWD